MFGTISTTQPEILDLPLATLNLPRALGGQVSRLCANLYATERGVHPNRLNHHTQIQMQANIMTKISSTKPTEAKLTNHQQHALLCIDLGNDQVKAMLLLPGESEWQRVIFPSRVQLALQGSSSCIQLSNDCLYLVGNEAALTGRTGATRNGKVDHSLLLVLHALRLLTGFTTDPLHVRVIYSTPSNKQFSKEITANLKGAHYVRIPADAEVIGSQTSHLSVVIHEAASQLEGYQCFKTIIDQLKQPTAWLIDIGGGTAIATEFNAAGRILQRQAHNEAGVHRLASLLQTSEALSGYLPKLPTIEEVTEFLFANKDKEAQAIVIENLKQVISPALSIIPTGSQIFLCGGGAGIKGVQAIGKPVSKNPQWANLTAIADVNTTILDNTKGAN